MKGYLYAIGAVAFMIFGCMICGTIETHYTVNATVEKTTGSEIYANDDLGNQWIFYGHDFCKGDRVQLYIFDNGTTTPEDDEIQGEGLIK